MIELEEADTLKSRKTQLEKVSRRDFLKLSGLAAGSVLLNACASSRNIVTQSEQEEKIQLVYQDWRTEWFPAMAQQMLERFHQSQANVRVFYVPDPADVEESLLADMQAGVAPDVFAACCSFFPILAQEDQTLDLRPFVQEELDEETINDWDPVQYRAFFTREGRQYGLPKYHGALALYYNKDYFDEYGVDYPDGSWDHDDYLEAMRRLTVDRDGDGEIDQWGSIIDISWDRIQMHVNGWGGHFVHPDDPKRSLLAEAEALEAMEWIRARMWDDRVMASPLDVQNMGPLLAFASGKVAMAEDGSWALKDALTRANFRIGVAPFPAGPVHRVTLATTDGFGIYKNTRYPRQSWELLKFLISKEYGRAMAKANFLQPARASLIQDWVGYIREEFPEKARDIDIAAFADGHIAGYSVIAEVFANMTAAKRLIEAAWDKIFTLGQEPVEIMKEVSRKVEEAQEMVT